MKDASRQSPAVGWEVLGTNSELLQVGDIIATQNSGLLSRLIRWFTRRRGQGPSWASHTAMVLTAEPAVIIIEAQLQVVVRALTYYERTGARLVIHRHPGGLTAQERRELCLKTLDYEGRMYGFLKVAAQALDHLLGDRYVFRRLAFMDAYPICSWLVAYAYDRVLHLQFGTPPNAAAPNDILDYCMAQGWECLWADSPATLESYQKAFDLRQQARIRRQGQEEAPS